MENADVITTIKESTDVGFLIDMKGYIQEDLDSIGADSDIVKKMKEKMHGVPIEEQYENNRKYLNSLIELIDEQIKILKSAR